MFLNPGCITGRNQAATTVCPRETCKKTWQKQEACTHMTCSCGCRFCYVCGRAESQIGNFGSHNQWDLEQRHQWDSLPTLAEAPKALRVSPVQTRCPMYLNYMVCARCFSHRALHGSNFPAVSSGAFSLVINCYLEPPIDGTATSLQPWPVIILFDSSMLCTAGRLNVMTRNCGRYRKIRIRQRHSVQCGTTDYLALRINSRLCLTLSSPMASGPPSNWRI